MLLRTDLYTFIQKSFSFILHSNVCIKRNEGKNIYLSLQLLKYEQVELNIIENVRKTSTKVLHDQWQVVMMTLNDKLLSSKSPNKLIHCVSSKPFYYLRLSEEDELDENGFCCLYQQISLNNLINSIHKRNVEGEYSMKVT